MAPPALPPQRRVAPTGPQPPTPVARPAAGSVGPSSPPRGSRGHAPAPDLRRRWRYYRTEQGGDPIRGYLAALEPADRAVVKACMKVVRDDPRAARHLRGELYEVRAARQGKSFRVVFMPEGRAKQVLVALCAFTKTSPRTPRRVLQLAEDRSRTWRERGARQRAGREIGRGR